MTTILRLSIQVCEQCNNYVLFAFTDMLPTEILRLTFPIRDGIFLKPFQLEHGKNLCEHFFQLRDSVYETIMKR